MKKRRSLRFRLRPVKRDAQRHDDREHAQVGEYVPAVRHDGRRAKEMQHAAVAAGRGEDLLGFEKHAAADDDADDERDRRRQTVFFADRFPWRLPPLRVCREILRTAAGRIQGKRAQDRKNAHPDRSGWAKFWLVGCVTARTARCRPARVSRWRTAGSCRPACR